MNPIISIENKKNIFKINYQNSSLELKSFSDEKSIFIDITGFNLIKAIQVAILTSTFCFLNEFKQNICWLVEDIEIKKAISILCLKNTRCLMQDREKVREIA